MIQTEGSLKHLLPDPDPVTLNLRQRSRRYGQLCKASFDGSSAGINAASFDTDPNCLVLITSGEQRPMSCIRSTCNVMPKRNSRRTLELSRYRPLYARYRSRGADAPGVDMEKRRAVIGERLENAVWSGTPLLVRPSQQKVKTRKLWACHLGPELGGQGYGQNPVQQIGMDKNQPSVGVYRWRIFGAAVSRNVMWFEGVGARCPCANWWR